MHSIEPRTTQLLPLDIPRDSRGRFRPGKPGGPGRPLGSLSRVGAPLAFFRDVVADWEQHGKAAIAQLCMTAPVRYFLLMLAIETGEFRVRRRRPKGN